jgi:hypothetical protein
MAQLINKAQFFTFYFINKIELRGALFSSHQAFRRNELPGA